MTRADDLAGLCEGESARGKVDAPPQNIHETVHISDDVVVALVNAQPPVVRNP